MLTIFEAQEICRRLEPRQKELRNQLKEAGPDTAMRLRRELYANRRGPTGLAAANRVFLWKCQENDKAKLTLM